MRVAVTLLLVSLLLAPLQLTAVDPVRIDYDCPAEDLDSFGLTCSEGEPCIVFLELTSVEGIGSSVFATGNLHTLATTLYGILLMSADGGETWSEANGRVRAATLDQAQFVDLQHGWISGVVLEPLPRNPFFLLTADGGKNWRAWPLFSETRSGSIQQFWFASAKSGELVLETGGRYERYETDTGGESWTLKESGSKAIALGKDLPKKDSPKEDAPWRARVDASTKTYRLEHRVAEKWEPMATFLVQVAECK